MTQPEVELRRAWWHSAGHGHERQLQGLLARYREPQRRYHTATHIMWVLRHVHELQAGPSPELLIAALYHDAVYDPLASNNEHASAMLAASTMGDIGWDEGRCRRVGQLIELTAAHILDDDGSGDIDAQVLIDADLAVLGAEPSAYLAYAAGVRAEYAHVDDAGWRDGRSFVLRSFLSRERIFCTAAMLASREVRAHANLTAELAALN